MEFESNSGIKYLFDNAIGISIPNVLQNNNRQAGNSYPSYNVSQKIDANYSVFYSKNMVKKERIRVLPTSKKKKRLEPQEIRRYIYREGLKQLTLGITEDCNLACKYCVYSDAYEQTRNSSKRNMDFKTAKTAIDYYVSLLKEGQRYNPTRTQSVGFYGGEPLLNFPLIKKCVEYIEVEYPDWNFLYTLTTNGTLLNNEKMDFLMEKEFSIGISLDGPENEHNRNRVYKNGKGTFKDIMKNVKRLVNCGYGRCHSLAVFDIKSDLFALNEFFKRRDIPLLTSVTMPKANDGCKFYDQFLKDDCNKYVKLEAKAFQWYLENVQYHSKDFSFFDQLFGVTASRTLFSAIVMMNPESLIFPYTGACIPGTKLFSDVEGNLHLCERINQTIPIGHICTGLDFEKIAHLMNNYREHLDKCPSCGVSHLCGECYCAFINDGICSDASKVCDNFDLNIACNLSRAFSLGEKHPDLLGMMFDDYYSRLVKLSNTMGD